MLQAAAREHIPVHPGSKHSEVGATGENAKAKYREVPEPEARPSIEEIVGEIEQTDWYKDQITYKHVFEARVGQSGMPACVVFTVSVFTSPKARLDPPLSDAISLALRDSRKIESLYTHQVAAIRALSEWKNVIVSTSTASGKSVIYQVITFDHIFDCGVLTALGTIIAVSRDRPAVYGDLHLSH